jgi:hypothetical protein
MSSVSRDNGNGESSDQAKKLLIGAVAGIVIMIVGLLVIAGLLVYYADSASPAVEVVRDLFVIVLALSMILIMVALTVLLIQVARFVNLMTNEISPIIDTASDTVNTVRGTAEFLSRHVTEPVVSTAGALGGIAKVVGDVDALRKAANIVMQATAAGSPTGARAESKQAVQPATSAPEAIPVEPVAKNEEKSENSIQDNF